MLRKSLRYYSTKPSKQDSVSEITKQISVGIKNLLPKRENIPDPQDLKNLKNSPKTIHLFDKFYWQESTLKESMDRIATPTVSDLLSQVLQKRDPPPEDPYHRDLADVGFRNHFLRIAGGVKMGRRGRAPWMGWTPTVTEAFRNEPRGMESNSTGDYDSPFKLLEFQREQDGTDYLVRYHHSAAPITRSQLVRRRIRETRRRTMKRRLDNTLMVIQYTRKNKTRLDYQ